MTKHLKNKNYLSLLALVIILVLGPLAYFRFIKPKMATASWWDDGWHYRTAITISNSGATDTDKKVKFDIDTASLYSAGKIKLNCDDSRFTDINGNLLPYFLDSDQGACNTASTDYYVLVSTINSGTTTIYHYYGKPSATKGSGDAQFSQDTFSQSSTSIHTEEIGKGPVVYWSFDEGQGSIAHDSNGLNHGTINGASWTDEGKADKALNFSSNQESLILNYMVWKEGQTGSATGFTQNGSTAENYRIIDTDPWGRKVPVWQAIPDAVSGADGGWNSSSFAIDNTKTYRFSVWVNRKVNGSNGRFYFGVNGYGSTNGVIRLSDGSNQTNPYFWYSDSPPGSQLPESEWVLVVAFVHPHDYAGTSNHADSGRYSIDGTKFGTIHYDYKWRLQTTTAIHRSYLYYTTDISTRQEWIYPRVDIVDGTEPSVQDLLDGHGSYGNDVFLETTDIKETISFWYDKNSEGNWQHIVKSSENYYVNGQPGSPEEYPVYLSGNEIYLGRTSSSDFITGKIDEFKIYSYARTADEIKQDYNLGSAIFVGQQSGTSQITPLKDKMIAHWDFNEGYGTTVNNTGNGGSVLNGTLGTGNSAPSWTNNGKFGKALSFNGETSLVSVSEISDGLKLITDSTFSISAWIKPSQTSSSIYYPVVGNQRSTSLFFGLYGDLVRLGLDDGWMTSNTSVPINQWTHILVNYDGLTKNATFFINGIQKNTASNSDPGSSSYTTLYIGYESRFQDKFNGLIDEVKIYNYALTEDEVKIDYNQGQALAMGSFSSGTGNTAPSDAGSQIYCIPGDTTACSPPIAEWNFEEGIGSTAYDTSGNNYSGGFIGTSWTQGKFGKGLKLEANTDRIVISSLTSSSTSHTFNFWIKSNQAASTLKYLFDTTTTRLIPAWNAGTSGKLGFHDGAWRTSTVDAPNDNKWHLLSFVFNGSNSTASIYIDGTLKQGGLSYNPITMSGLATIGGRISLDDYTVLGSYDQIRIYNYVRTPAQIAWDYNRGAPVAHWDFDECEGTSIHDQSGNSLQGTLTVGSSGSQNTAGTCALGVGQSAAWANGATGKYNSSLNFDGTDDYVSIGSTATYIKTLSFWAKPSSTTQKIIQLSSTNYVEISSGTVSVTGFGTPTVYVDGVQKTSFPDTNWHQVTVISSSDITANQIYLGRISTNYYSGQIDDVRIYNYPLTATQVKTLYNENSAVRFGD